MKKVPDPILSSVRPHSPPPTDTFLGARYPRLVRRRGKPKALAG